MSDFTLVGQLPRHHYIWVDTEYTHRKPIGFIPAVWYGLVSLRGSVWGCTVMLESGAIYRNLPPHAIAFNDSPDKWSVCDAQRWDCYGERFTTLEYAYLHGLAVSAHCNSGTLSHNCAGTYLFTVAPVMDGYSMYPHQAKEFTFVQLDNGRLTIQPTNHLVFHDRSFTKNKSMQFPLDVMKCQSESTSCEELITEAI